MDCQTGKTVHYRVHTVLVHLPLLFVIHRTFFSAQWLSNCSLSHRILDTVDCLLCVVYLCPLVRYLLSTAHCSRSVGCCPLFTIPIVPLTTINCLPSIVQLYPTIPVICLPTVRSLSGHCLLFIVLVHRPLSVIHYTLFSVCWLLPIVHYLLSIVYCTLSIVYRSLSICTLYIVLVICQSFIFHSW